MERMEHMTTSNERIASTGKNIQEKANLIWNVANTLFGAFKPHEYGLVILPMAVIKRFHDCLLPTHQAVLDKYKEVQHLAVKEGFLCAASGYQFYNISPFTFETLKADPENINENFRAFLNGFSDNVQDILARMNFHAQIDRMEEAGLLYQVIVDFCSEQGDMRPEKISAVDMGYIFENLVQRFSESYNEEAGAHFTSRDIIYLMCDLLVSNAKFDGDGISKTVYDMTMGTSQMLTCMEERLKQLDADADVTCFGQELNPFTFGIAKADMLIRGGDPDNMQFGNTLDDDKFSGYQFDYEISNPPFGIDWKREAPKVEAEHKKGGAGRFGPGLPSKSDGQMLFMLNGLAKLKPDGRMAIIQNGSSLFTGDAGSGQSEIRRYLIENDWLDAIVQLPNDSFYNTGIATYIWIITKDIYKAQKQLRDFRVYNDDDVEAVSKIYFSPEAKKVQTTQAKISNALLPIARAYNQLSKDDKYQFRRTIRSFVKWYNYISQIVRMFDKALHKEYLFCSYLARLLPAETAAPWDLENRVKLEYYRLEKTFEGAIELEDKAVPLEPERTKKAVNMNTKKDPLETVIEAINEVYKGSFTEADRVLIGTLREKLLADKKLRKAAKSDGQQIFEKNVFPKVFNDTAQASYIESTETYTKLFEDGAKYRAIMTALAQEIYREMRNEREDDHAKG